MIKVFNEKNITENPVYVRLVQRVDDIYLEVVTEKGDGDLGGDLLSLRNGPNGVYMSLCEYVQSNLGIDKSGPYNTIKIGDSS